MLQGRADWAEETESKQEDETQADPITLLQNVDGACPVLSAALRGRLTTDTVAAADSESGSLCQDKEPDFQERFDVPLLPVCLLIGLFACEPAKRVLLVCRLKLAAELEALQV